MNSGLALSSCLNQLLHVLVVRKSAHVPVIQTLYVTYCSNVDVIHTKCTNLTFSETYDANISFRQRGWRKHDAECRNVFQLCSLKTLIMPKSGTKTFFKHYQRSPFVELRPFQLPSFHLGCQSWWCIVGVCVCVHRNSRGPLHSTQGPLCFPPFTNQCLTRWLKGLAGEREAQSMGWAMKPSRREMERRERTKGAGESLK